MNINLKKLHDYPFVKLDRLLKNIDTENSNSPIALTIGEPQHKPPSFVTDLLVSSLSSINKYPSTKGIYELREVISNWLCSRFHLPSASIDPELNVLPVVGTREALFSAAQFIINSETSCGKPLVIFPSPFYQIYEGATLMAGAEPLYLSCDKDNNFLPDLDSISDNEWSRCQLFYLCSPANPTGIEVPVEYYKKLISLSDKFNFVIASDECYSEIYHDELSPPIGLLQVCSLIGRDDFSGCLVFNSLSKRSNLAGMRSGFVAGCKNLISSFLRYRIYHGSALPIHHQQASIGAWSDEKHVIENRLLYREKMNVVVPVLKSRFDIEIPTAGFCLWLNISFDDEEFAIHAFREKNLRVLPGQYLAREVNGINPGYGFLRLALVQPLDICKIAVERLLQCASFLDAK